MSGSDHQSTRTRLSELSVPGGGPGPGGPGGSGDPAHSEARKKKAARYVQEHPGPDTRKAGDLAEDESETAAGGPSATV
jgi:hypothetical protein